MTATYLLKGWHLVYGTTSPAIATTVADGKIKCGTQLPRLSTRLVTRRRHFWQLWPTTSVAVGGYLDTGLPQLSLASFATSTVWLPVSASMVASFHPSRSYHTVSGASFPLVVCKDPRVALSALAMGSTTAQIPHPYLLNPCPSPKI